jgi:hypothetical protein
MNFTILIRINKYDGEEEKRTEQTIVNLPAKYASGVK